MFRTGYQVPAGFGEVVHLGVSEVDAGMVIGFVSEFVDAAVGETVCG